MVKKSELQGSTLTDEAPARAAFAEWYYANRRKGKSPYEIAAEMHIAHIAAAEPVSMDDRLIALNRELEETYDKLQEAQDHMCRLVQENEDLKGKEDKE